MNIFSVGNALSISANTPTVSFGSTAADIPKDPFETINTGITVHRSLLSSVTPEPEASVASPLFYSSGYLPGYIVLLNSSAAAQTEATIRRYEAIDAQLLELKEVSTMKGQRSNMVRSIRRDRLSAISAIPV